MADDGSKSTARLHEPLMPAYQELSSTNHGAYVMMVAVILVIVSGLAVGVKLLTTLSKYRKLRGDDFALLAAMVFAIGYTISLCSSVQYGLGRTADTLTTEQARLLSQHYLASNILLYLSLAASQVSLALLIITIRPARWLIAAIYGTTTVSAFWGIAACFVLGFQCGPTRWVMGPTSGNTCIDQYSAHIGLKSVEILTDLALTVLPVLMVAQLQMSVYKRLVVILFFSIRIVTPITTAFSLVSLGNFYNAPVPDRPFEAAVPAIWCTVTLCVSLLTTCLPAVKAFFSDWAAGVTNGWLEGATQFSSANATGGAQRSSPVRSFGRSQPRSHTTSRPRPAPDATYTSHPSVAFTSHACRGREKGTEVIDDGDSKKGLTDGIWQTIDYQIDYEDETARRNKNTSSDGRART